VRIASETHAEACRHWTRSLLDENPHGEGETSVVSATSVGCPGDVVVGSVEPVCAAMERERVQSRDMDRRRRLQSVRLMTYLGTTKTRPPTKNHQGHDVIIISTIAATNPRGPATASTLRTDVLASRQRTRTFRVIHVAANRTRQTMTRAVILNTAASTSPGMRTRYPTTIRLPYARGSDSLRGATSGSHPGREPSFHRTRIIISIRTATTAKADTTNMRGTTTRLSSRAKRAYRDVHIGCA
jgi:hypothetical protein